LSKKSRSNRRSKIAAMLSKKNRNNRRSKITAILFKNSNHRSKLALERRLLFFDNMAAILEDDCFCSF
jgi:hypothetical protein